MHGVQRPISLEYQIYPPAIDTLVTGMDEGGKAGKDTFSCCTVGNFWPTGVCVALLNTHTGQLEAPPTTEKALMQSLQQEEG